MQAQNSVCQSQGCVERLLQTGHIQVQRGNPSHEWSPHLKPATVSVLIMTFTMADAGSSLGKEPAHLLVATAIEGVNHLGKSIFPVSFAQS